MDVSFALWDMRERREHLILGTVLGSKLIPQTIRKPSQASSLEMGILESAQNRLDGSKSLAHFGEPRKLLTTRTS